MKNEIKKILIGVHGKDKTFTGDELTSAIQQAILYLKELERHQFDEEGLF